MRPPRTLLLLLLVAACMQVPRYNTFVAPRTQFDFTGKRIAVVPLAVPDEFEERGELIAVYDSLVEAFLTQAGYEIVPASVYQDMWERLTNEAGGFYDPFTGARRTPVYDGAIKRLYRDLKARHAPDAFLFPEIWLVEAEYVGNSATWDGFQTERDLPGASGVVLASSLMVIIEDLQENEVFANGRGLSLHERYDEDTEEFIEDFRIDPLLASGPEAVAVVLSPLRRDTAAVAANPSGTRVP